MSESKLKVIFIGGSGRSGSTLLESILGQIDGFFSLGEMYHVWERNFVENQLCGCGKPFRECEFWQEVVKEAFGGFDRIDSNDILNLQRSVARVRHTPYLAFPKLRTSRFRSGLSKYIEIMERLYKAVAKVSGRKVLIDSSKAPPHGFILNEMSKVDLYVIHLVRDSRAVAYSWQRKKRRPEIHWKEAYMPRMGLFRSTREWLLSNFLTLLLGSKVPQYTVVSYEELTERPKETVSELARWVGMKSVNLDFFVNERMVKLNANHTVSGNPLRFKRGELEIHQDKEWKHKMPLIQQFAVSVATYPLIKHYHTLGRLRRIKNKRR